MEEVRYIAFEPLDADNHAHAFLSVRNTVYTVPALPEVDLLVDDEIHFNGPLVAALYGGTSLSPRTKRLILSTVARNPHYFTQLAECIRATHSIGPVATVVHATKKANVAIGKGVTKRRK